MLQTREQILKPSANALHGAKYKNVFHADFLYMELAAGCDLKNLSVIMNDVSFNTKLYACANAVNEAASSAWSRFFCEVWMR